MPKILIVDDEKDVVTLVQFLLEKDGHQVLAAHDGQEGLKTAAEELPDLILLDIMMPVMDGYTLNTHLQADPELRSIPVIVLTARGQMKDLFQIAPNVAAYIEKPFDPKHLRELIQSILSKKKTAPDAAR